MAIRLFNSLSRKKEEFKEIRPGRVTFYSCGPTVHDYSHIGNFKTFIVFDLIKRYLTYRGYRVLPRDEHHGRGRQYYRQSARRKDNAEGAHGSIRGSVLRGYGDVEHPPGRSHAAGHGPHIRIWWK